MFLVERDVVVAGTFKLSGLSLILRFVAIALAVVFVLDAAGLLMFLSPLLRFAMILNFRVCVIADLV